MHRFAGHETARKARVETARKGVFAVVQRAAHAIHAREHLAQDLKTHKLAVHEFLPNSFQNFDISASILDCSHELVARGSDTASEAGLELVRESGPAECSELQRASRQGWLAERAECVCILEFSPNTASQRYGPSGKLKWRQSPQSSLDSPHAL